MDGTATRGPKGRIAKAPTLAKRFGLIKAWLAWCSKQGYIDKNPSESLELPARMVAKERTKKGGFSHDQLAAIFRLLAPYRLNADPLRVE